MPNRFDAFISHSSADARLAKRIATVLKADGILAWLDQSDIRVGFLLRNELQQSIYDSRTVILLWSKPASRSRWVAAEIMSAYHQGRFIIPCVLDSTRLPQFLASGVYLKFQTKQKQSMRTLARAVREAPDQANELPPSMQGGNVELDQVIGAIAQAQKVELDKLGEHNTTEAASLHAITDALMRKAEKRWKFDRTILALAGYHRKNAYMLKHWDAIQAGRGPQDPLLRQAERRFFETLFVNPIDCSGLDGLGSVLMLERELDAAEFFFERAIAEAKKLGFAYQEALENLENVRRFKRGRQVAAAP
jgi:hypothetical protein